MRFQADDDGVNVPEVSTVLRAIGEFETGPSGFEAVACMERSELELGRPPLSPCETHKGIADQLKGDRGDRVEESASPIVVRGGRAVHIAKGRAERQREHSTHLGKRLLPAKVPSTLLAIEAGIWFNEPDAQLAARLSEEPGAGKPHAGICEGGAR